MSDLESSHTQYPMGKPLTRGGAELSNPAAAGYINNLEISSARRFTPNFRNTFLK